MNEQNYKVIGAMSPDEVLNFGYNIYKVGADYDTRNKKNPQHVYTVAADNPQIAKHILQDFMPWMNVYRVERYTDDEIVQFKEAFESHPFETSFNGLYISPWHPTTKEPTDSR